MSNEKEIINGNLTFAGVSAPVEMWETLGVCRANWLGRSEEDQPACLRRPNGLSPVRSWLEIQELLVRAKDELPDATPERIIGRATTLASRDRDLKQLTGAIRELGRINVSVPPNINVWQHLKGEGALQRASGSLADAAEALVKSIATSAH